MKNNPLEAGYFFDTSIRGDSMHQRGIRDSARILWWFQAAACRACRCFHEVRALTKFLWHARCEPFGKGRVQADFLLNR
jgi:hypothetical protein